MRRNIYRVYFDTNIFEDIVKKKIDISIDELNSCTNIIYYISTAHVEEYFIAIKNDVENKFSKYNNDRKLLMTSLRSKGILNPSITRIVNKPEKFDDCLFRVKKYDTINRMVENGRKIYQEQDKYFKDLLSKNPNVQNNSNLDSKEIWDRKEVKYILSRFQYYVKMHNAVLFSELEREYGTNIALKIAPLKEISIFEIKKSCFKEICNNYSIMEFVFEFLHSTLNKCGYSRDKKDSNVISGIYDTTHSIYGTYCNYFVTSDNRLRKRVSAIYDYLGVPTRAITFNEFLIIADKIK